MFRKVAKVFKGEVTHDGAQVKLTRFITPHDYELINPFLLFDEFKSDVVSDYIGGFPPHPHRGFETITYMIYGSMRHKDNQGNEGVIGTGSVQWMKAARGIIHEEIPEQKDGLLWGYQLWLNLPQAEKALQPRYIDIGSASIVEANDKFGKIRIIAGSYFLNGKVISGHMSDHTLEPYYFDVTVAQGHEFSWIPPIGHTCLVYVISGSALIGDNSSLIPRYQLVVLNDKFRQGGMIKLTAQNEDSRLLILAASSLDEPMVHRGPFVMNTEAEINQAFKDYSR